MEQLEERTLLAGFQLLGIQPNADALLNNGDVRNVAFSELKFRFSENFSIDPTTLDGIQVMRSVDNIFGNGDDVIMTPQAVRPDMSIVPGFVGIGEMPNIVVMRFAETLPDDIYRITVTGNGVTALQDLTGGFFDREPFTVPQDDVLLDVELNLGAQVISVVPQPLFRDAGGALQQNRDQIVVYFNDDDLVDSLASAENPAFYQLIFTRDTATNLDDVVFNPTSVSYDPALDRAILTFPANLEALTDAHKSPLSPVGGTLVGIGAERTYRLRIGTAEAQQVAPLRLAPIVDPLDPEVPDLPGSTFATAFGVGMLDPGGVARSQIISSEISPQQYLLEWPGAGDEPGHREIIVQDHLLTGPDSQVGITEYFYNFEDVIGFDDANGNGVVDSGETVYHNLINPEQKQRAREIFEIYGSLLGVQFVETANLGFTIGTGDMQAIAPGTPSGPGGVLGITVSGAVQTAIMDGAEAWDNAYGETGDPNKVSWFLTAMHEIGHLLGLGHTDELPPGTVMNEEFLLSFTNPTEPVFPGDHDIVHGLHLYRPESKDIDLYSFELVSSGLFSAETIAERLPNGNPIDGNASSLLDTYLILYDAAGNILARNDDYYSEDSFLELNLEPGTYFIGVSASGNDQYNPLVEDSGFGGKSQGVYDLRLNFRPDVANSIVDTGSVFGGTSTGAALDGDADGAPGGVYSFWFRTNDEAHTRYVDKSNPAAGVGNGTRANPYKDIDVALMNSASGDIVRIVGNHDDNPYRFGQIGGPSGQADGVALEVPRGVTVMVDANASLGQAIFKFFESRVSVGSSSSVIDRSRGAFQVLGTPEAAGTVIFTSLNNDTIGTRFGTAPTTPVGFSLKDGDWGGVRFRNDIDNAASRFNWENQGIFLNYVNHAEISYGGGDVPIGSQRPVVAPISMIEARPSISFNTIRNSADAAMDADPNSFLESNFHSPRFQLNSEYTSNYKRVGPDIHGNLIVGNSINGLYIRVATLPGQALRQMTVSGRWDDTDIVHVLAENLVIAGTPGGPVLEDVGPSTALVTLTPGTAGALAGGNYSYIIVFVDTSGAEGLPSGPTATVTVPSGGNGSVTLSGLPAAAGAFVSRRIYRSANGGPYELVAQINATSTSFVDTGTTLGAVLNAVPAQYRARTDARLAIDPGLVVKLANSRIDVGIGAQLIAEGLLGREVIFTSLLDDGYGVGGTSDTTGDGTASIPNLGNWSGIAALPVSTLSIDHAVIRYGGGISQFGGTTAGFNVLEIYQANARVTNSVIENNADGTGGQADPNRLGRGFNDAATIFVRGAQPVIVGNIIRNGAGAAISINANALNSQYVADLGRSTGSPDNYTGFEDNHGALVRLNRLGGNEINGMRVRGQTLTTEGVWDDTDIVHVVFDTIYIPDLHSFGGLRLQSTAQESLVVKFSGANAGITATGRALDIDDRIGGSLHILGQPGHPVVLTSLADDTVGAGFDPRGNPQTDTNNDQQGPGVGLPTGPEVDNGTLIDNDVPQNVVGFFGFQAGPGGQSGFAAGQPGGGITAQGNTLLLTNTDVIFEYFNYVDVGSDGAAVDLGSTTITQAPTLVAPDVVVSMGEFMGQNGLIQWTAETRVNNGQQGVITTINFNSVTPLGNLRLINYLDEDIGNPNDDLLYLVGTPGAPDFRAFTLDGPERVGFSQGGAYVTGPDLVNATFDGWAADQFPQLRSAITGAGTMYSVAGNIDTVDLVPFADPQLGNVFGLTDITTAFAWSVDPSATTSTITVLLESVAENPATGGAAGDWRGITLDQYSNDRNVDTVVERESFSATPPGTNATIDTAQFLGGIAPHEKSGDENLRLGFTVHGSLNARTDVDIYSFEALAATEVWFDIDRTTHSLDTIVELLDFGGNIIASSNNSELADHLGSPLLPDLRVNALDATDFYRIDQYTTNPRDAGMRVVLPGPISDDPPTYHLRVRSNGELSQGNYVLQLRLREIQEFGGSTIRNADIRFATNGIEILGMPGHSPLLAEAADQEFGGPTGTNDTFATAQDLGNLLNTDRAALGVAGLIDNFADIDVYRFEVFYDSVQGTTGNSPLSTIFDIDYAAGAGGPDTSLAIFNVFGELIFVATTSNIADDLAGPLEGADIDDLLRGSVNANDPFIGPVTLSAGTYYVAVTPFTRRAVELEQFLVQNPVNPLVRLQPIDSVQQITHDLIGIAGNNNVIIDPFLDTNGIVPFHLGDVVLYLSQDGPNSTRILTVDPFTGQLETTVGTFGRDTGDVVVHPQGRLYSLTHGIPGQPFSDANVGNYIAIDAGNGQFTLIGDDGIQTFIRTGAPPNFGVQRAGPNQQGVGIFFDAMTYFEQGSDVADLYAVGRRGDSQGNPPGVQAKENILYIFDPYTGIATSAPSPDRGTTGQPPQYQGAGTQIRERGVIVTSGSSIMLVDVTSQNPLAVPLDFMDPYDTVSSILDGLRFTLTPLTGPAVTYELDLGPTAIIDVDPSLVAEDGLGQRFLLDGDYFVVENRNIQYDTGFTIDVEPFLTSLGGASTNVFDGDTIIVSTALGGVTFEFDSPAAPGTGGGNIAIPFTPGVATKQSLINSLIGSVSALPAFFGLSATQLQGTGHVSLAGATNVVINTPITDDGLLLAGAGGPAPIVSTPLGGFALVDGNAFTITDGTTGIDARFEFDTNNTVTTPVEQQTLSVGGAIDEVQTLRGNGTAGTFQITFNLLGLAPIITGNIAFNANLATVQNAVNNAINASGLVPNYVNDDLLVTGAGTINNSTFTFTYTNSLGAQDHGQLTAAGAGAPAPTINTTTDGRSAVISERQQFRINGGAANMPETQTLQLTSAPATETSEVQRVLVDATATGGNFDLTVNLIDGTSVPITGIAFNATAAAVQPLVDAAMLLAAPGYVMGDLLVSGQANMGTGLEFTFNGSLTGLNHPLITPNSAGLTPAGSMAVVSPGTEGDGDTITITLNLFGGQMITTPTIAARATAATVQDIVDAAILASGKVPGYTAGDISVETGLNFMYGGSLDGQNHDPLTVSGFPFMVMQGDEGDGDTFTLTLNLFGGAMVNVPNVPFNVTSTQLQFLVDNAITLSGLVPGYVAGDLAVSGINVNNLPGLTLTYNGPLSGFDHLDPTFDFSDYVIAPTPNPPVVNTLVTGTTNQFDLTFHFFDGASTTITGIRADADELQLQALVDAALVGVVQGYVAGDLDVLHGRAHSGIQFDYNGVSLSRQNHGQLTVTTDFELGTPNVAIATLTNATTAIRFNGAQFQAEVAQNILSAINRTTRANRDFDVYARFQGGNMILSGTTNIGFTAAGAPMAVQPLVTAGHQIVVNETDTAAQIAAVTAFELDALAALTGAGNPPITVDASAAAARLGMRDAASVSFTGISRFNEQQFVQITGATGGTFNLSFSITRNAPLAPANVIVTGIPFDADAATVQNLIDAAFREVRNPTTGALVNGLPGYVRGDIRVGGDVQGGLTLTFAGTSVAGQNHADVQVLTGGLMGPFTPTFTTLHDGGAQLMFQERAAGNGGPAGLSRQGQNIPGPGVDVVFPIDVDMTAAQLASALVGGVVIPPNMFPTLGLIQTLPSIGAMAVGGTIEFRDASYTQEPVSATPVLRPNFQPYTHPLLGSSVGTGGRVTGIAILPNGNRMFAVDNQGGFYELTNYAGVDSLQTTFVTQILDGVGNPVRFAGLTAGPATVENGVYADTLFAVTETGVLYAINPDGTLAPIFLNGATSAAVPLNTSGAVTGLDFSTLEQNLWHVVPTIPFNTSATPMDVFVGTATQVGQTITVNEQQGAPGHTSSLFETSFHFGQGSVTVAGVPTPRSVDFPGGAYGVLESNLFNLQGYSAADQPVLYFSYYAETEGVANRDAFRVYASVDDAQWSLLASTDTNLFDYSTAIPDASQFWRQARVPLDQFAGEDNVRLRFEFSTSDDMNLGDVLTTGSELRAVPGTEILDGHTMIFSTFSNGTVRVTFEFDLGYIFLAPGGVQLTDGETFTISDGVNAPVVFEFDNNGLTAMGNRQVPFGVASSAGSVAQSMVVAIDNAVLAGLLNVTPMLDGERINIPDAVNITIDNPLSALTFENKFALPIPAPFPPAPLVPSGPGVNPGNIRVAVNFNMTPDEVALALADELESFFSGIAPPVPPPPVTITEPPANDTLATALSTGITLGAQGTFLFDGIIGDNPALALNPELDVDMISLNLAAGVTIDISAMTNGSGLDSHIRVFDPFGNELAFNDDEVLGVILDARLSFTAPSQGTYIIAVSNNVAANFLPNFAGSGTPGGSTGGYTLSIAYNNVVRTASKLYNDVIQLIGHQLLVHTNPFNGFPLFHPISGLPVIGPLTHRTSLPDDQTQPNSGYHSNTRGQNNRIEGIYLDDIIIGFAERGEVVSGANINTAFTPVLPPPPPNVLGNYQLEIRPGPVYGGLGGPPIFDTNDRHTENYTLIASHGYQLVDGATFFIDDGGARVVFEYNDTTIPLLPGQTAVQDGHIAINYTPADPDYLVAQTIVLAVNSQPVQEVINIAAGLSDGLGTSSTSNLVNLYGNARPEVTILDVTETTLDANALVDVLLGPGVTRVGDAQLLLIDDANSAGFFIGGRSTIGIDEGIILSTGNAFDAEGPNLSDSSGMASQTTASDPQLEAALGLFPGDTMDPTVLEFSFQLAAPGDLSFRFVFASEEYNEFANTGFNDAFAFILNGVNIALIPGTTIPVSINTINGGNPLGTNAINENFYRNNDPNDGGEYLGEIGLDGFTTVLTAQALGLAAGVTHTIRLTISDVGDTIFDSAVFLEAGSFQVGAGDELPTGVRGLRLERHGDQNRFREQGQIVIDSVSVTNSSQFGIVIDAGQRNRSDLVPLAATTLPHAGSFINFPSVNLERLSPGAVVMNSLVANSGQGGIHVSGDPNSSTPLSSIPFARLINNTLFGTLNNDVGIQVDEFVSPSLINNIVSNFTTGISVDATSSSTFVTGTIYKDNLTNAVGISGSDPLGDNSIPLQSTDPLFVDPVVGNYYLADLAQAIDSAVGSVEERLQRLGLLSLLGIEESPIVAPIYDLIGQRRTNDPRVNPPLGSGLSPDIDRGAIDRADFIGPITVLRTPIDNDATGLDQNPAETVVTLGASQVLSQFSIQFVDGVDLNSPLDGTGVDDSTVFGTRLKIFFNSSPDPLIEGVHYTTAYEPTNNVLTFNPVAGIWEPGVYNIVFDNSPNQRVITAPDGAALMDGQAFQVVDDFGGAATFEFLSGFRIQVTPPLFPLSLAGETFTINDGVNPPVIFEFTETGFTFGTVPVLIPVGATDGQVVQAMITAINGAGGLGLTPVNLGNGLLFLGGTPAHTIATGPSLALLGQTTTSIPGAIPIQFFPSASFDPRQSADAIATAIASAGLNNVVVTNLGTQVLVQNVMGINDVVGMLPNGPLPPIRDIAGNDLRPNQTDGSTQFTITLGIPDSDYGDAPVGPGLNYPTLLANGARHRVSGANPLRLGSLIDIDLDGQPSPLADGDDIDGVDDEDGVVFPNLFAGGTGQVTITVNGGMGNTGRVDAWIDFNNDGDWDDAGEKILDSVLITGTQTVSFSLATAVSNSDVYARFRLSSAGGLTTGGPANDGEVEDYRIHIGDSAPGQNKITNRYDVFGPPTAMFPGGSIDGLVNFFDLMYLIQDIRTNGFHAITAVPPAEGAYLDPTGDNLVNFSDVIAVLNKLRNPGLPEPPGAPAPEGEPLQASTTTSLGAATSGTGATSTISSSTRSEVAASTTTTVLASTPPQVTAYDAAPTVQFVVTQPLTTTEASSSEPLIDLRKVFTGNELQVSPSYTPLVESTAEPKLLPLLEDESNVAGSRLDDELDDDPWSQELESSLDEIADDVGDNWTSDSKAVDSVLVDLAEEALARLDDDS